MGQVTGGSLKETRGLKKPETRRDVTVQQAFASVHDTALCVVREFGVGARKILSCPVVVNINPCTAPRAQGFFPLCGACMYSQENSGYSVEVEKAPGRTRCPGELLKRCTVLPQRHQS